MAFELILGTNARPGSKDVCEKLLSLHDGESIDSFREAFLKRARDEADEKYSDRDSLANVHKLRDEALAAERFDEALAKCVEVAEIQRSWHCKENLLVAIRCSKALGRTNDACLYSALYLSIYAPTMYNEDENQELVLFNEEDHGDPVGTEDCHILEAIDSYVAIDSSTPLAERFHRHMTLDGHFRYKCSEPDRNIAIRLVAGLEKSEFFMNLAATPNFRSMGVSDRIFLWLFVNILESIQTMRAKVYSQLLVKRVWFIEMVKNLASVFVSFDDLGFLLWVREQFLAVTLYQLAWANNLNPVFKSEASIFWLTSAMMTSFSTSFQRDETLKNLCVRSWIEEQFPFDVLSRLVVQFQRSKECRVLKCTSGELAKSLDLTITLATVHFTLWKGWFHEKAITPLGLVEKDLAFEVASRLAKELAKSGSLLQRHYSWFALLASRLKFAADNVDKLKSEEAAHLIASSLAALQVLLAQPFGQLSSIKPVVEMEEFREPFCSSVSILLKFFDGPDRKNKAFKKEMFRLLCHSAAIYCRASSDFTSFTVTMNEDKADIPGKQFLYAVVVRNCWEQFANNPTFRKWPRLFFSRFLQFHGLMPIDDLLNSLLTLNFILGKPSSPTANICDFLVNYPSSKESVMLNVFVKKLLSTGSLLTRVSLKKLLNPNPNTPCSMAQWLGEDDRVTAFLRQIGYLISGIVLANFVEHSRNTEYFKDLTNDAAARKTVIKGMHWAFEETAEFDIIEEYEI